MKKVKNISEILIDRNWISLGIYLSTQNSYIYGPNIKEIRLEIHLFIIHVKIGVIYPIS